MLMLMLFRCAGVCAALGISSSAPAEWRVEMLPTLGPVTAVESAGVDSRIAIGGKWYRFNTETSGLEIAIAPERDSPPDGALPDALIASGGKKTARAWLAEPTHRYPHGVLGDTVEAGRLVIERWGRARAVLRLGDDAVFEDIGPRIADLGGIERLIAIKSYLDRGSALAIVDAKSATIVAETLPIGRPYAWLNPAGIADFDGDGTTDIALVRQPHVVGRLELWSWRDGKLTKAADIADTSNHTIGSRALDMSATADFDGDGRTDLAVPSLDRRALRLIAFAPHPRDIGRIPLPGRVVTNIGTVLTRNGIGLVFGLDNGALALVRDGSGSRP
jgi:VCBS repeat protein